MCVCVCVCVLGGGGGGAESKPERKQIQGEINYLVSLPVSKLVYYKHDAGAETTTTTTTNTIILQVRATNKQTCTDLLFADELDT